MLLKPTADDFKIVGFHLGRLVVALGLVLFIPLICAIFFNETEEILNYSLSIALSICIGLLLQIINFTRKDLNWLHGMAVASSSWLVAMLIGAIPLFLSGFYASYLDACFEAMSGFATTGLSLVIVKNHISNATNMWRHLIMFLGGQGIVVIGLTFFIKGTAGAYRMYVGEARDEKVLPNVIQTARFIWIISLVYLFIGTILLGLAGYYIGMEPVNAFLHGMWIFMAAFDTGGFGPQGQNILYYHSGIYETIIIFFMLLGTINFGVHYAVWGRNFKEPFKNIETKTLFFSILILTFFVFVGLLRHQTYGDFISLFRKGFFHLVSGHSGTGYMTIYAQQFATEWKNLTMFFIMIAMGIGGSACSTAGGMKVLRLGIFFKALGQDIKKVMLPGRAIIVSKFHHLRLIILREEHVRSALMLIILFILLYLFGTAAGVLYGYPLYQAAFESVSAAANVGLSCGITDTTMPTGLKIIYILQMWVGRLEFISIFGLLGFLYAKLKGR